MTSEARASLTAVRQTWDEKLQDHIAPAQLAIGVIRDMMVRHRLHEAMNLLETWDGGLVYAFHNRSRVWVLRGDVSHAVDTVGAWQREEELPEPSSAFMEARESLAARRDEWKAIAEAEKEDRRQRRARCRALVRCRLVL
jgi:FtsZ-binding cell division protein ZapB